MNQINGMYQLFGLTIVKQAVADIRTFVNRRKVRPPSTSNVTRNAIRALKFLNGSPGRRGLTFEIIANGIGRDAEQMRDEIFRQFTGPHTESQFRRLLALASVSTPEELFAHRSAFQDQGRRYIIADDERERVRNAITFGRSPDGRCFLCNSEITASTPGFLSVKKFCSRLCNSRFSRLSKKLKEGAA